ncbi:SIMPL domain-containing protein [Cecembia rubra]|uniref:Uncharacterized protein n=2 Tax=Cecembia rubra TaxID=1485585 RepID=A0A2P8EAA7_9BACT|nr:SIMPL domain-containing protein [Cecembia rubra]PSL06374.1 hypothetical protein CLV48_102190 [Cecembia rubra]
MKKLILILPVYLLYLSVFSQQIPTIEVEGLSEISIMPDEAILFIHLTEKALKVSDATNALNKKTKGLEDAIKKSGAKGYDFFVDNYNVYVNRIYTKGTSRDSGYVASQNVRIRVTDIQKELVKITEAVHQSGNLGFNLSMQVSDKLKKESQKKLLEMAIEDAKQKSETIAKTLGVEKVKVFKVQYTPQGNVFYPIMREAKMAMSDMGQVREDPVFRPEEQKLTDKVILIFSFEN